MTSQKRIYVDTSVYLCTLINGSETKLAKRMLSKKVLCSSILLLAEAQRNIVRMTREKIIDVKTCELALNKIQADTQYFIFKAPDLEMCLSPEFPAIHTPKTNDLLHLRTALWFSRNGGIHSFATFDQQLKLSAVSLGFKVI